MSECEVDYLIHLFSIRLVEFGERNETLRYFDQSALKQGKD